MTTLDLVTAGAAVKTSPDRIRSCPTLGALPPLAEESARVPGPPARPEQPFPALPSANTILALTVLDDQGGRWTRMPEDWAASAALCQAVGRFHIFGVEHVACCRQRAVWACGDVGFCGGCFGRLLDLGVEA